MSRFQDQTASDNATRVVADGGSFLLAATQGALFRCTGVYKQERASEVWRKRGSGWDRGGRWEITRIGVLNRETTKDAVAEIPLITDTMLLLAVTPSLPSTLTSHHHAPPPIPINPEPPELCKQPLLHANKGPRNASGAFKCQGFPNPFLLFYVLKELLFLSFLPLSFLSLHSSCTG